MNSATWRRRIVARLSSQTRDNRQEIGITKNPLHYSTARPHAVILSAIQRTTAKRFSPIDHYAAAPDSRRRRISASDDNQPPATFFPMQTVGRSWLPGPGNASAYVLESGESAPPPNQPAAITDGTWPKSNSGDHHA